MSRLLAAIAGGLLMALVMVSCTSGSEPTSPSRTPTEQATMPDLRGLSLVRSVQMLSGMGTSPGALHASKNDAPIGTVIGQGVAPGTPLGSVGKVPLLLSAGPDPHVNTVAGKRLVGVGGTCELEPPNPSASPGAAPCVGGPLVVPLAAS